MKILAVDDDQIILELLQHFVTSFGDHELVTVDCPIEALALLQANQEQRFDCFLVDIQMPQMTGIELVSHIRQMKQYMSTPVLMLTAMTDKSYVDGAFRAGATDYVTKPFEVNELRGRINLLAATVPVKKVVEPLSAVDAQPLAFEDPISLHDPLSIFDVDNVISYASMENYVMQLSRGKLFGSTSFGFGIREIEALHARLSPFEFHSMIADVAEVVSDAMADHDSIMSYAGGGVFVAFAESSWRPAAEKIADTINLALSRADLIDNDGKSLDIRVSVGRPVRLVWKTSESALDSLGQAYDSAVEACEQFQRSKNDFWHVGEWA